MAVTTQAAFLILLPLLLCFCPTHVSEPPLCSGYLAGRAPFVPLACRALHKTAPNSAQALTPLFGLESLEMTRGSACCLQPRITQQLSQRLAKISTWKSRSWPGLRLSRTEVRLAGRGEGSKERCGSSGARTRAHGLSGESVLWMFSFSSLILSSLTATSVSGSFYHF